MANSTQKKKILFVIAHFEFSNGISSTLRSLIDEIDQEKFEIHVLPLFKVDEKFIEPIKSKFILHKGFGFYFRGFSKIVKRIPAKWLYHLFIREKFDLEVAYQFFGNVSDILASSNNPNKISWLHIINPNSEHEIKSKAKVFNKIITVSESVAEKLNKMGVCNTYTCYNLLHEDVIAQKAKEPISLSFENKTIVATVARISSEKAFIRQLRCIETISKNIENVEYWIIGNGPCFAEVKEYIKSHNMDSYVKLLGKQNNPYKYLAKADLYLCGSLREGFSTACQEAAILGIPVITTEVDGANELITLTGCGRVIPNEESAITEDLKNILSDDTIISQWKETAERNKSKLYKAARIAKIEKVLK